MKKSFLFLFLFLSIFTFCHAQQKVLFIGNSMTASNDMTGMVSRLASAGGDSLYFYVHWGGQTFQQHLTNPGTMQIIRNTQWDYVVLQENSTISGLYPGWNQGYFEYYSYNYARELNDSIKHNHKCSQTIFFMLWGYIAGDTLNFPNDNYASHQARMRRNYLLLTKDFDGIASPVGMAWQKVRAEKPWLNLYSGDGYHPSLAGSYLAAAVFYASIYNKNPYELNYNGGLADSTAHYLRNVAGSIVLDSLSVWNINAKVPNSPPNLVLPINNADQVPVNSAFVWNRAPRANGYRIDISKSPNFSTILQTRTLTDTTTTFNLTDYGERHYWRVSANYTSVSFTQTCSTRPSDPFTFTTPFVGPRLSLPRDSAECISMTNAVLMWEKLGDFNRYVLHISTLPNFKDTVIFKNDINGLMFAISLPNQLTRYYWRVQAYEGQITNKWSQPFSFVTSIRYPDPISPANKEKNVSVFLLKWAVEPEADSYQLQISLDSAFNQIYLEFENLTVLEKSIEFSEYQTRVFWRVAATKDGCKGPWSTPWEFTTALKQPELLYPPNSSENIPLNITFQWKSENSNAYEISISDDSDFENIVFGRVGIPVNSVSFQGFQPLTKYYWKARYRSGGDTSPWSEVFSFTTGAKGLQPPLLSSPEHNATKVPVPTSFEWWPSEDAKGYNIQISETSDFSVVSAELNAQSSETSWETDELENFKFYFWRVKAIGESNESGWSQVWTFRTIALPPTDATQAVYPENKAKDAPTDLTLSWLSVERAEGYKLFMREDTVLDTIIVIIDDSEITYTSYIVKGLKNDAKFYWTVTAWNEAGWGPESEEFEFITEKGSYVEQANSSREKFSIFPNPSSGAIFIRSHSNAKPDKIEIFNAMGILTHSVPHAGAEVEKLDVSFLPAGCYWIKANSEFIRFIIIK